MLREPKNDLPFSINFKYIQYLLTVDSVCPTTFLHRILSSKKIFPNKIRPWGKQIKSCLIVIKVGDTNFKNMGNSFIPKLGPVWQLLWIQKKIGIVMSHNSSS